METASKPSCLQLHSDPPEPLFTCLRVRNPPLLSSEAQAGMAESDWDTVTVLRKKGPTAAQAKSKQVGPSLLPLGLVLVLVRAPVAPQVAAGGSVMVGR